MPVRAHRAPLSAWRSPATMDPSRTAGQLCTALKQAPFERALSPPGPGPVYHPHGDSVGKQPLSTKLTAPSYVFGTSQRDEHVKNGEPARGFWPEARLSCGEQGCCWLSACRDGDRCGRPTKPSCGVPQPGCELVPSPHGAASQIHRVRVARPTARCTARSVIARSSGAQQRLRSAPHLVTCRPGLTDQVSAGKSKMDHACGGLQCP